MQLEDKFSLLQGQILTFAANACGLFGVKYCRSDVGFSGKHNNSANFWPFGVATGLYFLYDFRKILNIQVTQI